MPLKRISDQRSETIEAFYLQLSEAQKGSPGEDSGQSMLELIKRLNEFFYHETIWCLTSHNQLVLLENDSWHSPWYVMITCVYSREFHIEYRMPDGFKPWEDALVRGMANSLHRAIEYILIAMRNSGGWQHSAAMNFSAHWQ
jgi:hypothetical protein